MLEAIVPPNPSESMSASSPRFGYWVSFFIFSTITLGATIEAEANADRISRGARSNQQYALSCAALVFALSTVIVFLHTRPVLSTLVLGTKLEGIVILVLLSFWTALVAIVSDTRQGLATDASGAVSNGNLYYFSWAGLATGVLLITSYCRTVWGVDVAGEIRTRAARLQTWVWFCFLGCVQMGSSARIFDNHCAHLDSAISSGLLDAMESVAFCRRCKFGVSLGCITTVGACIIVGLKIGTTAKMPLLFMAEMGLSVILVFMHAFGVAFVTSQEGPGAPLNNLYYSSWGCFLAGLTLAASCVTDYTAARELVRTNTNEDNAEDTDEREGLELQ